MSHNLDSRIAGRGVPALWAMAVLAGGATIAGALTQPVQFAYSWLLAFMFFFTLCAGSLFWLLLHHAVDASWSVVVRRQWENIASLCGVLGLFFIPFVLVAPDLWSWMGPAPAHAPLLAAKQPYLTPWFFWLRAAGYFVFLVWAAGSLRAESLAQDADGALVHTLRNRRRAFVCLPLFALVMTFAPVDWLLGLDYRWFSTIWGVYVFAGSALASLALTVVIMALLRAGGYFRGIYTPEHDHITGKLLLAFCLFWGYAAFSQFLIIWYPAIPGETSYFAARSVGSWKAVAWVLGIAQFAVPFLLLLPRSTKRNPVFLCAICLWLLAMHLLDLCLVIQPVLHPAGFSPSWLDAACIVTMGSALAAIFLKRLSHAPLWPLRDPGLTKSIRLNNGWF